MSMTVLIILILAVIALIIGVILAAGDSGPRVTIIKQDDTKDGDDA